MKTNFTQVKCYYTGGGIYVFSARWEGSCWIYGGLDNYMGCYSVPGEEIEEQHDCRYEDYEAVPVSGIYPTWRDVFHAIHENIPDSYDMERSLLRFNPDLSKKVME